MTRKLYAVFFGELTPSQDIPRSNATDIQAFLKTSLENIGRTYTQPFILLKNDQFLGVTSQPETALRDAILFRLMLIASPHSGKKSERQDTRVTIGIGTVDEFSFGNDITGSRGEAFTLARQRSDPAEKNRADLVIVTPWPELNTILDIECRTIDTLVGNYTKKQAEAVLSVFEGKTQEEIAREFNLSQSAISYRLKDNGIELLKKIIAHYEVLIKNKLDYFSGMNEKNDEAKKYSELAISFSREMQYSESSTYFSKSLALCKETGNQSEEARILLHAGMVQEKLRKFGDALESYTKSQELSHAMNNRAGEALALNQQGFISKITHQPKKAS